MSKIHYYCEEIDDEHTFTRQGLLDEMGERWIPEIKAYKVKPEKIPGMFFCHHFDDWTSTDDNPCGKHCDGYEPRNGKSGRCRFHDIWSYEATDEFIILKAK